MRSSFQTLALATFLPGLALAACRSAPAPAAPATSTSASAAAPAAAAAAPLAGTRWRLLEIQSMDDAVGTTRPDDPSLYTLVFQPDGRVAMRLNCNRGTGPWSVELGAGGNSGNLRIGPLAMTRALCPEPSLDERIARDMDHVRSYLLRDGLLSLSLMADGGVYHWRPDESSGEARP